MATASEILARAREAGLTIRPLPDGHLSIRPAAKLTDELREALKQHKPEILAALTPVSHLDQVAELRRLIEAIARCAPSYWTQADVDEAVMVGSLDLDAAIQTFAAILAEYREAGLRP